ncbi:MULTISPECIES: (2Fe-2S)-binding protein [Streptomyces]|uniref:(2Fe-2S)-binding protein n=1 Tax=Streptomyces lycii TaxID=2654337 RepID=A0ABQ7FLX3_9ACTN|nr:MULTISPECIES: (2Fe-2S)-binding protein [Streptomyces]KAF4408958.1 (2Fe-2S)-binding protein [Streptomyces lycii]PGH47962.1 iron-sulfur protein [Streptomyces sp. Ru87]
MSLAPAAPAPALSPLAGAYNRLTSVFPSLQILEEAPRSGGGWVTASELAAGGPALEEFISWDDAQVLRDYGQRARPDVVASFALHRYAWPACLLITLPWFLLRRVPRMPVEAVSFQRTLGRMTALPGDFACLPDDPAAGLPEARVVPDEEALRGEVRDAVAEHLGPVLDGFRPKMRRGPRAMWGMATDEIVESLWYVGHLLGEEKRAVTELEALLPGTTKPYVGGPSFRELTGPKGEPLPTRDRASCCLFYTLRPEDTCVTCPRTCDAERVERLANA